MKSTVRVFGSAREARKPRGERAIFGVKHFIFFSQIQQIQDLRRPHHVLSNNAGSKEKKPVSDTGMEDVKKRTAARALGNFLNDLVELLQ